jgi:hypothetical protein
MRNKTMTDETRDCRMRETARLSDCPCSFRLLLPSSLALTRCPHSRCPHPPPACGLHGPHGRVTPEDLGTRHHHPDPAPGPNCMKQVLCHAAPPSGAAVQYDRCREQKEHGTGREGQTQPTRPTQPTLPAIKLPVHADDHDHRDLPQVEGACHPGPDHMHAGRLCEGVR